MENNLGQEKNEDIIEQRKQKLYKFLKSNRFIFYLLLAIVVFVGLFIRTRNFGINSNTGKQNLWDIATDSWTLGPDLDPFLFLRWAEHIVEHGRLMIIDSMRYVPIGYDTSGEMKLLSYMIAWFYRFLEFLPKGLLSLLPGNPQEASVTYAAVLFPVLMFGLTIIAFFFLVQEVFDKVFKDKKWANLMGIIASLFLSVVPALLPRTIAGIPEKESAGFLFIFLSFYFFIKSVKSRDYKWTSIHSVLAGVSTAALGLLWGGVTFVFMTIGLSVFLMFLLGQINQRRLMGVVIWAVAFMPILVSFSSRYHILGFFASTSTIPILLTVFLAGFEIYLYPKIKNFGIINSLNKHYKIPKEFISLIIIGILGVVAVSILFGPGFIPNEIKNTIDSLVHPFGTSRVALTVAENREPFFNEWKNNFGPVVKNIPLFFWLFMFGASSLVYRCLRKWEKRDRLILTSLFFVMIIGLVFSRLSPDSVLNGSSASSLIVYFGGICLFLASSFYYIFKYNKEGKRGLLRVNPGLLFVIVLFLVSVLAARGGARLIMMMVPPASIVVSYLVVSLIFVFSKQKSDNKKMIFGILSIIVIIAGAYSGFVFYQSSVQQASVYYPQVYQWQWQKAMKWVDDNTSKDAVFGHWWDYGYWVQSIGHRATVLDGGNAITYWNHLMGRHVLTAESDREGLNFLYTHNATHFLIDSTEIGKYGAYSSIGSDVNYDRISSFATFGKNEENTKEIKNGVEYFYGGGVGLDEDIVWEVDGKERTFVKENSGIGAVVITEDTGGDIQKAEIIVVQNNAQTRMPLKKAYYNGRFYEFDKGIDAGVFLVDVVVNNQQGVGKADKGALLYLSPRIADSFVTRKYLFGEQENFELVHNEPHYIVDVLRQQGMEIDDFVYYQGSLLGPIKIWEIEYPSDVEYKPEYLEIEYPEELL